MQVTIIGIGLIGGSLAMALKEKSIATHVIGVDNNPAHAQKALDLGLVDEIADLETAVRKSSLIIISIPVNAAEKLITGLLDLVDKQVVMDTGSTKESLINIVRGHRNRSRVVTTHPMWGTEYSGPEAAIRGAFQDKATVICNKNESD